MSMKKALKKVRGILLERLNERFAKGELPKDAWENVQAFAFKHIRDHAKDRNIWRVALRMVGDDLEKFLRRLKTKAEWDAKQKAESEVQHGVVLEPPQ